ncbi:acyltransferase family protein [Brevundimonas diminuta]|uniref:acyltransferase family protein n=1 Tax=Brevundimonas diminuta TaxID=293 RepID=UPI001F57E4CE|nr:acyltransferase [Brevundimonas diminuta]
MTEDPAPPERRRPPPIARGGWLDLLRFVVGAMIVLYHFREAAPIPLPLFHPVFDRGYLLTDFFIIDSGYVLARVYGERLANRRIPLSVFYRQRFLRVVPAHMTVSLALAGLVLTAAILGQTPSHPEWFDWSRFPAQFFLVQAYGVPGGEGWNASTWTLSALLGCYVSLPFLARAARGLSPWLILALGVGGLLAANLSAHAAFGLPIYEMPLRLGFLRAFPLFALGVAVALFARQVYCPPRLAAGLGGSAVVAVAGLQALGPHNLATLGLLTVIIFATGALPIRSPSRLVEHLALMAFAIFLTNEVIRIVWFGVLDAVDWRSWSPSVQWTAWAVGLAAAFGGAAVFRYAFDRPTQAWFNRPQSGSRSTSPAAKSPVPAL